MAWVRERVKAARVTCLLKLTHYLPFTPLSFYGNEPRTTLHRCLLPAVRATLYSEMSVTML